MPGNWYQDAEGQLGASVHTWPYATSARHHLPACRTQQRMADSLQAIIMEAVSVPKSPAPVPSAKPTATPSASSPAPVVTAASGPAEPDSNGKGGRKLML